MGIHVFCDNSNVWLGAGTCRVENEPHVPSYLFRLHFRNLFTLVEGGRQALTRELAGSLPPECEPLWEYARNNGYNTNLLHKIDDGTRIREQSVDEALHLKIANALLDHEGEHTLIIMTGDGAQSDIGTAFSSRQSER
ncbi:NYN domain-containing protein [Rhizobium binxianense]